MTQHRSLPVPEGLDGMRLDAAISRLFGLSRTAAADLVAAGCASLDGRRSLKSERVTTGAVLDVDLPGPAPSSLPVPTVVDGLRVVYEDGDLLVVDKPVGVAAHPSPGWEGPTVVGGLAAAGHRVSTSGAEERQGIVHRLDVGTSGLMVVAKSERAYTVLKDAFRERTVDKRYHTLVQGHPDPLSGTVDAPIDRHPSSAYKFAVVAGGRDSITHYETIEAFRHASLLEIHLETGRTHQIRVHMAALQHPCVGDVIYGADPTLSKKLQLGRQWLHAVRLSFAHPDDGRQMSFDSPYPPDLQLALDRVAAADGGAVVRLRELDDRIVPRAAGRLRETLENARWSGFLDPPESSRLRRLDERYASSGPLSLLREFPQLGLLLITAVFLSGTAVALVRGGPDGRTGSAQDSAAGGGLPLSLGPEVGSGIEEHFAAARERAVAAATDEPTARFLALLSLSRPVPPAEAEQLATQNGLTVRRVYLRAPVTAGLAEVLPVEIPGDLLPGLAAVFEQTAQRKTEEQREFASLASSIEPISAADAEFRAAYEADAQAAGDEAAAYRTPCACLIALVVEGPAAGLVELTALPAVRGVELARRGAALTALDILPLFPEVTGVVPAPAPRGS